METFNSGQIAFLDWLFNVHGCTTQQLKEYTEEDIKLLVDEHSLYELEQVKQKFMKEIAKDFISDSEIDKIFKEDNNE